MQVCDILHRHLHTSLLVRFPHWGAGGSAVPVENQVLHQTLVHCPAPDQLCHEEEIGSNVRGNQ